MQITERQLRTVIRNILLEQDTGQSSTSPAADQAHKQVEQTFQATGASDYMTKGDAAYNDIIARFPAVEPKLEKQFSLFEEAKTARLTYLQNEFPKRYEQLRQKLEKTAALDAATLQKEMISRIQKSQLMLAKYPAQLKVTSTTDVGGSPYSVYSVADDPESVWSKRFPGGNAALVKAFAPIASPNVFALPPILFTPSPPAEIYMALYPDYADEAELKMTYEHELIHQEDWAVTELVEKSSGASEEKGGSGAAGMARQLIASALIPADQFNINTINQRFAASTTLSSLMRSEVGAPSKDLAQFPVYEGLATLTYLGWFINRVLGLVPVGGKDYPWVGSIERYAADTAKGDMQLSRQLVEYFGSYQNSMLDRIRDITSPSHLRIALTQMRPFLEEALATRGEADYGGVVEDTLSKLQAQNKELAYRAAAILTVTDPTKLRALTQVAAAEPRGGSVQGAQGTGSALAERWERLAGLVD